MDNKKSYDRLKARQKRLKEKFLKAFADSKGIIAYACEMTGISRQCYYNWLDNDDDFASKCNDVQESSIDLVEAKLLNAINDDNLTAIIFYLKTKGKKRGYVEQIDQNVSSNTFEELMKSLPEDDDEEG